jgi:hypothetical protein
MPVQPFPIIFFSFFFHYHVVSFCLRFLYLHSLFLIVICISRPRNHYLTYRKKNCRRGRLQPRHDNLTGGKLDFATCFKYAKCSFRVQLHKKYFLHNTLYSYFCNLLLILSFSILYLYFIFFIFQQDNPQHTWLFFLHFLHQSFLETY